jgi:uncharacterized protein YdiU (UPF0061 family)
MDFFNKNQISNHSDTNGRYSYTNQPKICKWNLLKLAEALDPYVEVKKAKEFINS